MFIVLRQLRSGSLASLLTYEHGKIIAHCRLARPFSALMTGALVEGELALTAAQKYPFLNDVRLYCPVILRGHRSQLFLHFIVEAVYLFLPQGHHNGEIFVLMHMAIESQLVQHFDTHSALGPSFCLVLFDLLGFHPPFLLMELNMHTRAFLNDYVLANKHLDASLAQSTLLPGLLLRYDSVRGVLQNWIAECLGEHPQFKKNEKMWLNMLRTGMWE